MSRLRSLPTFKEDFWNDPENKEEIADFRNFIDASIETHFYTPDGAKLQRQNTHLLFVYGTLKSGFSRHECLKGCRFIGNGFTKSHAFRMQLSATKFPYPIVRVNNDPKYKAKIYGEVWEVPTSILYDLDTIESNGSTYRRLKLPIILSRSIDPVLKNHVCRTPLSTTAFVYIGTEKFWSTRDSSLLSVPFLTPNSTSSEKYYNFLKVFENDNG